MTKTSANADHPSPPHARLPDREELGYQPLYVIPESHPSQAALSPENRDIARARLLGAVWVREQRHMRVGRGATAAQAAELIEHFGSAEARARAEAAYSEMQVPVGRLRLARASYAELEAAGQVLPRSLPDAEPAADRRLFLYPVSDPKSPWSLSRLIEVADRVGAAVLTDEDRQSKTRGLRYIDADGPRSAEIEAWAGEDARRAHAAARGRSGESQALMRDAAATLAGVDAAATRPLAVPNRESDPEGYDAARASLGAFPTDRLEAAVRATRRIRDAAHRGGAHVRAAALGRGEALGEEVLRAARSAESPERSDPVDTRQVERQVERGAEQRQPAAARPEDPRRNFLEI